MTWRGRTPAATAGAGSNRAALLDMPNSSRGSSCWGAGYPPHCILDAKDLGWTHIAGGASELLVAVDWFSAQVTLPSSHVRSALRTGTPWLTPSHCWQVFDCRAMHLLQEHSIARKGDDQFEAIAALPVGRVAAGNRAGIEALDLTTAGCEAAPAGAARRPTCAAETILSRADTVGWCAPCPWQGRPGPSSQSSVGTREL